MIQQGKIRVPIRLDHLSARCQQALHQRVIVLSGLNQVSIRFPVPTRQRCQCHQCIPAVVARSHQAGDRGALRPTMIAVHRLGQLQPGPFHHLRIRPAARICFGFNSPHLSDRHQFHERSIPFGSPPSSFSTSAKSCRRPDARLFFFKFSTSKNSTSTPSIKTVTRFS